MASTQMDALGAFSHLADSVPAWIDRVSDLATHTAAKHAEYTAAYKKLSILRRPQPRRRKNSSVCSVHSDNQEEVLASVKQKAEQAPPAADTEEAIDDDDQMSTQGEPYNNPRKRGADDLISIASDEDPNFLCMRHNVVIEFDGHTQNCLEDLVREIDSNRNNLRKGKMSALRPTFRLTLTSDSNGPPRSPDGGPDALLSNIRSARGRGGPNGMPFDTAVKQLEGLDSLCEKAAHQVLRVGHCNSELAAIREKCNTLQEMARSEAEKLKRQQEQQRLQQEREQKRREQEQRDREQNAAEETVKKPKSPEPAMRESTNEMKAGTKRPSNGDSMSNAIEVDENAGNPTDFIDLSAFRAARRMRS